MSAIFGSDPTTRCANCGILLRLELGTTITPDLECKVCEKLGDRSLLRFMREMREARSDEERAALRARFDAAKGRSWNDAERRVMEKGE